MSTIKVSTVMSKQLFVCTSDDELSAAERIMCEEKVRRSRVLDKHARLVRLLSPSDIARRADQACVKGAVTRTVMEAKFRAWPLQVGAESCHLNP
jgi:predicted transcriptional regulator